ncbi:Clp protease ClpP [Macrococcus epidermidis]|uniref:ATP-dependent Clp protease proteolytic subunit n=1 Tax=Macrococcus epidermidis TaxID=1902580 RepID=A0A327ZRR2_9STAP|nr:head maturation protease, ClpP-related [Macrococcus epidermidis]RAK45001.1 Clp protease ClpP [Macrococcus epidermidis]
MTKKTSDFFQMQKKAQNEAEIYIYGPITNSKWEDSDVTASDFKEELKALGDVEVINLHINSGGGSVFGGHAIYNMLKSHKAKINVYVDALAASIASVIAMSGDAIFMHENSMMMIHNSWIVTAGNAKELRETADLMEKMDKSSNTAYLNKNSKVSQDQLEEMLKEDYWMTAQEAYELGFADEIIGANQMAASITEEQLKQYSKVPEAVAKDVEKVVDTSVIEEIVPDSQEKINKSTEVDRKLILERCKTIKAEVEDFLISQNKF